MWRTLSPEVRRLWIGFGVLFVGGHAFKAATWQGVQAQEREAAAVAHAEASRHLAESRASARKYALPPLERDRA